MTVIEKPQNPSSNLTVIGVYLFKSKTPDAVDESKPSNCGLLESTDAIQ